jgi:hypothetical protein
MLLKRRSDLTFNVEERESFEEVVLERSRVLKLVLRASNWRENGR